MYLLLADFAWNIFFPSPYSVDLVPNDFHLFAHLRQLLGVMHVGSNEEVRKTVEDWFSELAADLYDAGIQKLVTWYNKCLNRHGHYVEKRVKVCSNGVKLHFYNYQVVFTFCMTYMTYIQYSTVHDYHSSCGHFFILLFSAQQM